MKCKRKFRAHRSAGTVWINLQDNLLRAGLVFTFRFQIHRRQIKASQSELTRRWSQGKVRYVNCICHSIPASTHQDLAKDLIEGFPWRIWRIMKGRIIALAIRPKDCSQRFRELCHSFGEAKLLFQLRHAMPQTRGTKKMRKTPESILAQENGRTTGK